MQGLARIVQSWHGVLQVRLFQINSLASIKVSVLLLPLLVLPACDSASPGDPNVIIAITNDLVTSEDGDTASFGVLLTVQPTSEVRIPISSSNTSEGTVDKDLLIFTPNTWSTPQTVIISGVDDDTLDGDVNYSINIHPLTSIDTIYAGLDPADLTVVNLDNDGASPSPSPNPEPPPPSGTPGVVVMPTNGLVTTEDMASAQVSIVLNTQPDNLVRIDVTSSDTTEGRVLPAALFFGTNDWDTPQVVTVTGVDDQDIDGDIAFAVDFSVLSNDAIYNGISVDSALVTNRDNDSAQPVPVVGVTVSPTAGLITSEDATTTNITVALDAQPTDTVSITVTSSDTTEGTVSPANLQFDATNWNAAQTVAVTGVDDQDVDGDMAYSVDFSVQSNDTNYNGIAVASVSLTNHDNDTVQSTPGVIVSPTAGLITSEDAATTNVTVVLDAEPTDVVSITATSSDTTEGTVAPDTLQFDATNWSVSQTVTVTGVDDPDVDGDMAYSVDFSAQSNDANYNGIAVDSVSLTNQDNDVVQSTPGVTVSPTAGLITSEDTTTTNVTVVLDAEPTDVVSISVTSSDTTEGTVAPASLQFDATNWDTSQSVTVTGVDDPDVDGDVAYSVDLSVQSNDTNYNGIAVASVSLTNQDNDVLQSTPGVTVSPTAGLITSEDATATNVTIVLDAEPTDVVSISATSSDTTEGTVAPASLQFEVTNWDTPQTFTVTGVDDPDVDGDMAYSVDLSVQSSDTNYNGIAVDSVSLTNQDNDVVPPPATAEYTLYLEPGNLQITASEISGNGATSLNVWGYSLSNLLPGTSPGPVIEAVVGQTVSVEIINDLPRDHGFEIQGLVPNTVIPLGGSATIEFTPTEAGVYKYGDPELRSNSTGLNGAVVVRPADASVAWTGGPAFDQERTWVVTDMDKSWNDVLIFAEFDPSTTPYEPNYFLLNGMNGFAAKQDPASTLQGTVGETILVRIVNAGRYDQSLHFHANHFQIISQDGIKVNDMADAPWVTTVNVKRGSTAMVLYTLDKPGTYPVHVHSANMETGNGVYLNGTATFIIAQ